VPSELIADMYPRLHRQLVAWGRSGADLAVWPFLHYQLGGFATGADGETAVPGLYLAGEMTGGLHGRNRLMGNGITDALVLGRLAGAAAASYATARGS
jgi:aspartate oxidase